MAKAPKPLQWALMLAAETGLRQSDLVALPWSAYDPAPTPLSALGWITWTPSNTITRRRPKGRRIPVTRRLRALLDELWAPRKGPIILTNSDGRALQERQLRSAQGSARRATGRELMG